MKQLKVQQVINDRWRGPDIPPDVDKHVYNVVNVVDSTRPAINDTLTREALQVFCDSDAWRVVIS